MSTLIAGQGDSDPVELVVNSRRRDLGGFEVRRVLPQARKRMVGPFIFLDQMGPLELITGQGIDVLPHPHIGLSTLTYLLDGSMTHRDSMGIEMDIRPGDVNWMAAGRGVAHSERTPDTMRNQSGLLMGLQAWVALPCDKEEDDPGFQHLDRGQLPLIQSDGLTVRLIAGRLFGEASPVEVSSPLVYAVADLASGVKIPIDPNHEERAVYVLSGAVAVGSERYDAGGLMVLRPGATVTLTATTPARLVLLGGEPLEGPRHIWWNFVSSSKEKIEQAKEDWRRRRFGDVVNDFEEFVPLPTT